ncbi:hypothetical protein [Ammoniphilus resinae]|uniref:Uncharacterized protein n=1 Tax=Ammoniphilus resinae TaxID=861532 RepID=A0ABS4GL50_9BACL|nr:hypothetical protein [Ammoniphilus resinae]MBP1930998.1 hypothetical protein [Ammoniphilus resinae]
MERNELNQDPEVQVADIPEDRLDTSNPMIEQVIQTDVDQEIYRKYRYLYYE